jgi:hypothetical protein
MSKQPTKSGESVTTTTQWEDFIKELETPVPKFYAISGVCTPSFDMVGSNPANSWYDKR